MQFARSTLSASFLMQAAAYLAALTPTQAKEVETLDDVRIPAVRASTAAAISLWQPMLRKPARKREAQRAHSVRQLAEADVAPTTRCAARGRESA